jgi:hypothetical protein
VDADVSVDRALSFMLTIKSVKNGVFWVVTPGGSCHNGRFAGTSRLLHQGDKKR